MEKKSSSSVHSYRVHREKKISDDAGNNTALDFVTSNKHANTPFLQLRYM